MHEEPLIILLLVAGIVATACALVAGATEDARRSVRCEVAGGLMMKINDTTRCVKSVQYIEVNR